MSDVNLLALGCGVSFIVVAGAYVYLRECWAAQRSRRVVPVEAPARKVEIVRPEIRDVA